MLVALTKAGHLQWWGRKLLRVSMSTYLYTHVLPKRVETSDHEMSIYSWVRPSDGMPFSHLRCFSSSLALAEEGDAVAFLFHPTVLPALQHPDCSRGLGSMDSWGSVWNFDEPIHHPLVISSLEAQAGLSEEARQCTVNHVSSLSPQALLLPWLQSPCPQCCAGCPFVSWCWVSVTLGHLDSRPQGIGYFSDMCSVSSARWKRLKKSHNRQSQEVFTT